MKRQTEEIISKYDGLKLSLVYTLPEGTPKGIVQISHGMCENKERYLPFMEFLSGHGYAAVIHDHRGHGKSVRKQEDLGYFYKTKEKGIVQDLHQVTEWIKEKFPEKPVYLLGHSMGTLVARNYLKEYDYEVEKLTLTGPPCRNPAVGLGLALARIEKRFLGEKRRSGSIQTMAFGPYVKKFRKEKRISAWICSDPKVVEEYEASKLCGFLFTTDGFESLFLLLRETYSKRGWKMGNPNLPVLFLGGSQDPCVGGERKFVQEMRFLKSLGYQSVKGRLYPGMRHEILNEKGKRQVYEDILAFLEREEDK